MPRTTEKFDCHRRPERDDCQSSPGRKEFRGSHEGCCPDDCHTAAWERMDVRVSAKAEAKFLVHDWGILIFILSLLFFLTFLLSFLFALIFLLSSSLSRHYIYPSSVYWHLFYLPLFIDSSSVLPLFINIPAILLFVVIFLLTSCICIDTLFHLPSSC